MSVLGRESGCKGGRVAECWHGRGACSLDSGCVPGPRPSETPPRVRIRHRRGESQGGQMVSNSPAWGGARGSGNELIAVIGSVLS